MYHHIQKDRGHHNFKKQFLPCNQAVRPVKYHLQKIIQKAYQTESKCQYHDRHNSGLQPEIQKCHNKNSRYDCNAAHRRRSRLLQMRCHALLPLCLIYLFTI